MSHKETPSPSLPVKKNNPAGVSTTSYHTPHNDPKSSKSAKGKGKEKETTLGTDSGFTNKELANILLHSPHKPAYDPKKDMAGSYDEDDERPTSTVKKVCHLEASVSLVVLSVIQDVFFFWC